MSKIEEIIKSRSIPYVKLKDVEGTPHFITHINPRYRPAQGKFSEYNGYDIGAVKCNDGSEFKYTAPTTLINIINELGGADAGAKEFSELNTEGKAIVLTQEETSAGTQYYKVTVTEKF